MEVWDAVKATRDAAKDWLENGVEYEVRALVFNEDIDLIAIIGPERATPSAG